MFMVDDRFYGSDPVVRIPRSQRAEAIGTWTLCGAWSAHFLKDGWVPLHMIEELGGSIAGADALVAVGLWKKKRQLGYQFSEWAPWQKLRVDVEKYRAGERQRKADARAAKSNKPPEKPGNTGTVPGGHSADSALPSPHPSPDPLKQTDNNGQSEDELTSQQPEGGPTVDNPVESVDDDGLERVSTHASKLSGMPVDRITAKMIAEHYLDRAKSWPANPTRYVLVCLTRENHPVLVNFLQSGRWSE